MGDPVFPPEDHPGLHHRAGYMAKIEPEFTKRNTKLIGLSVDSKRRLHARWLSPTRRPKAEGQLPDHR